jgi:hypothetical protein
MYCSRPEREPSDVARTLIRPLLPPGLSLFVDSYFWQRSVWPELGSLIFNVVEGRSAEWGVSLRLRHLPIMP